MENDFKFGAVLSEEEVAELFSGNDTEPEEENEEENDVIENDEDRIEVEVPEDEDDKDKTESEDATGGDSPKNFYSSVATAFKEDGILFDSDDFDVSKIESADDFVEMINKQVQSKLDERQKRVDEALGLGVQNEYIQNFESTISQLESITDDMISAETDDGEKLRASMIYNEYLNKGFSVEKAKREVKKSIDAGTDIEDAKESLEENKKFYYQGYDNLLSKARDEQANAKKYADEQAASLKKTIMEEDTVFGDIVLDKSTRQKIYDNIAKPIHLDKETGNRLTAIQKYERENRVDFLKNLSLLFTLTDGFKSIDSLVKTKATKEVNKSIKKLESTLNSTSRNSDGSIKYITKAKDDPNSIINLDLAWI